MVVHSPTSSSFGLMVVVVEEVAWEEKLKKSDWLIQTTFLDAHGSHHVAACMAWQTLYLVCSVDDKHARAIKKE